MGLSLGLASSVSADDHLPTAGEILQEGRVLHKEVHLMRDAILVEPTMDVQRYASTVGMIAYHIIYDNEYYDCVTKANGFGTFTDINCTKLRQDPTTEFKSKTN